MKRFRHPAWYEVLVFVIGAITLFVIAHGIWYPPRVVGPNGPGN